MFQGGVNEQEGDMAGDNTESDDITNIELTQTEFGEAFGMKPNSTFIEHMFMLLDENRSGHLTFLEFKKVFILLSKGVSLC